MRILVYSKTRLFADCLASGLDTHQKVDSSVGLSELAAVERFVAAERPCFLVIDLSNEMAWDEAKALSRLCTVTLMVGLAVHDTSEDLVRCAQIGCAGVIPHESTVEHTVNILMQAKRGELSCSAAAAARLMRAVSTSNVSRRSEMPDCLTRREGEIARLVCEGLTNKEIARELSCSEGTVKNHMHSILSKLGVSRRSALQRELHGFRAAQPMEG